MSRLPSNRGGAKSRHLSVFLIREGITQPDLIIQDPSKLEERQVIITSTLNGRLYIKPSDPHEPSWLAIFENRI